MHTSQDEMVWVPLISESIGGDVTYKRSKMGASGVFSTGQASSLKGAIYDYPHQEVYLMPLR